MKRSTVKGKNLFSQANSFLRVVSNWQRWKINVCQYRCWLRGIREKCWQAFLSFLSKILHSFIIGNGKRNLNEAFLNSTHHVYIYGKINVSLKILCSLSLHLPHLGLYIWQSVLDENLNHDTVKFLYFKTFKIVQTSFKILF